jgi:hypothetical protein
MIDIEKETDMKTVNAKRDLDIMKDHRDKYLLHFDNYDDTVYLIKHSGEVAITPTRALMWVIAGITSFEGHTRDEMLEKLILMINE